MAKRELLNSSSNGYLKGIWFCFEELPNGTTRTIYCWDEQGIIDADEHPYCYSPPEEEGPTNEQINLTQLWPRLDRS